MTRATSARILAVTMDERGHVGPTLWLADRLIEQGHSVKLMMPTDETRDYAESSGLEVFTPSALGLSDDLAYPSGVRALAAGESRGALAALPFDLLMVNGMFWPLVPAARGAGIPAVVFWTSLPMEIGFRSPVFARVPKEDKPEFRWQAIWKTSLFRTVLVIMRVRSALGGDERAIAYPANPKMKALSTLGDYRKICRNLTAPIGYPSNRIIPNQFVCPIEWTEVVLGPRGFDICREPKTWRHYAGAAIAPSGKGEDVPTTAREKSVLVAVGSKGALYDANVLAGLLRNVYTVACRMAEVQFYVSMPDSIRESVEVTAPDNVDVRSFLPQVELLQTVDAFVSHCGFGSLKESYWAGVPILAMPFDMDQPRNALVAAFHGVGIMSNPAVEADQLEADLRKLLAPDSTYRQAAQQWRKQLRGGQEMIEVLEIVAAILNREVSDCPHLPLAPPRG